MRLFTVNKAKISTPTMKRTLFLLCMTASLSVTASAAFEDDLLQMERDWNNSLKTRNLAWFEKNLAEDLTDVSSANGAMHSKSQDIAALKEDKTVYESLELSDLKARMEGNAGVVTGINHIKGRDDQGQPFEVKLAFTDTYIKRSGQWQVWASQHTRVKP